MRLLRPSRRGGNGEGNDSADSAREPLNQGKLTPVKDHTSVITG